MKKNVTLLAIVTARPDCKYSNYYHHDSNNGVPASAETPISAYTPKNAGILEQVLNVGSVRAIMNRYNAGMRSWFS